jgi:hypothetical protein
MIILDVAVAAITQTIDAVHGAPCARTGQP